MKITEIRTNPSQNFNYPEFQKIGPREIAEKEQKDIKKPSPEWQQNILLQGLDQLENNIQMDDNHPLDKSASAPIETYEEALEELKFTKNSAFREYASPAQANIRGEDIISLFVDEEI